MMFDDSWSIVCSVEGLGDAATIRMMDRRIGLPYIGARARRAVQDVAESYDVTLTLTNSFTCERR
jgi:hypothetical protein